MELNERLARLETLSAEQHRAVLEKFDAGYQMLLEKLKPVEDLREELHRLDTVVERHEHRISFVRGVLAILGFAWTAVLAYLGLKHNG